MAIVTWAGGTHRITDPTAWVPGLPGPGDTGDILDGTALAVDQTVGPYALGLINESAPSIATFESTITGAVANNDFSASGESGFSEAGTRPTLDLVGSNALTGSIDVALPTAGALMTINITDATSPDGVTVQQGVLTNTGSISGDDHYCSLHVTGSADAELVNNGVFGGAGFIDLGVAVIGTGTIDVENYDAGKLTIEKAVAATQTVNLTIGELSLHDPIDFRATIDGFSTTLGAINLPQQIDAARFVNHVLVLTAGNQLVAELKFANDARVSDFLITSSAAGTFITSVNYPSGNLGFLLPPPNITVTSTGTVPALPPIVLPHAVVKLPSQGPNLTFTSGAHVASVEAMNGYTIFLEGSTAAGAPSVNETSTTFGSSFALRVEGQGSTARFGGLEAVGYNGNAGIIAATSGPGGGAATMAVDISDVTSPDGVTILTGAFNNTGAIDAEAGSTIDISGTAGRKLINAGTVTANGSVFVGPTVTGTGIMTVGNHTGTAGSLELAGEVSTGQSIMLEAGKLTIDEASAFHATIYDFDARDMVVLKGLDVTSVQYNNGALLLDGGSDGTLHFHRPNGITFNTATFLLNHSGSDTIITTPALTS